MRRNLLFVCLIPIVLAIFTIENENESILSDETIALLENKETVPDSNIISKI